MSRTLMLSLFGVVCLCAAASASDLTYCQWPGNNGYDLTPLTGQDLPGSDATYNYLFRFCDLASETVCHSKGGSMCQYTKANGWQHVLSSWNSTGVWSQCTDTINCPSGGVQVSWANGDPCGGTGPHRSVTVQVACSTSTATTYQVIEPPNVPCTYTVLFSNKAGCQTAPPTPAASSTGAGPAVSSSTGGASSTGGSAPSNITNCKSTINGNTYDLQALVGADYASSAFNYNWDASFCDVASQTDCRAKGGSACQYTPAGAFQHVLAKWDTTGVWSECTNTTACPNGGVMVTFNNGDICGGQTGVYRQTIYRILCDAAQTNRPTSYVVTEPSQCAYEFTFSHAAGCPVAPPNNGGGGGGNGGKVAGAVIGVLLGVGLIAAGVWYYRKRQNANSINYSTGVAADAGTGYQQQV